MPSIWLRYILLLFFLRAIFFLIFSPLVFDGFSAGFGSFFFISLSLFHCALLGHNNNLSSDLRSCWQKSFQDNSFSGAASGKRAELEEVEARAWAWAEGLLAKYPLAFAKSVERKGPLVNTL